MKALILFWTASIKQSDVIAFSFFLPRYLKYMSYEQICRYLDILGRKLFIQIAMQSYTAQMIESTAWELSKMHISQPADVKEYFAERILLYLLGYMEYVESIWEGNEEVQRLEVFFNGIYYFELMGRLAGVETYNNIAYLLEQGPVDDSIQDYTVSLFRTMLFISLGEVNKDNLSTAPSYDFYEELLNHSADIKIDEPGKETWIVPGTNDSILVLKGYINRTLGRLAARFLKDDNSETGRELYSRIEGFLIQELDFVPPGYNSPNIRISPALGAVDGLLAMETDCDSLNIEPSRGLQDKMTNRPFFRDGAFVKSASKLFFSEAFEFDRYKRIEILKLLRGHGVSLELVDFYMKRGPGDYEKPMFMDFLGEGVEDTEALQMLKDYAEEYVREAQRREEGSDNFWLHTSLQHAISAIGKFRDRNTIPFILDILRRYRWPIAIRNDVIFTLAQFERSDFRQEDWIVFKEAVKTELEHYVPEMPKGDMLEYYISLECLYAIEKFRMTEFQDYLRNCGRTGNAMAAAIADLMEGDNFSVEAMLHSPLEYKGLYYRPLLEWVVDEIPYRGRKEFILSVLSAKNDDEIRAQCLDLLCDLSDPDWRHACERQNPPSKKQDLHQISKVNNYDI